MDQNSAPALEIRTQNLTTDWKDEFTLMCAISQEQLTYI